MTHERRIKELDLVIRDLQVVRDILVGPQQVDVEKLLAHIYGTVDIIKDITIYAETFRKGRKK